jgi:hypothetical protein
MNLVCKKILILLYKFIGTAFFASRLMVNFYNKNLSVRSKSCLQLQKELLIILCMRLLSHFNVSPLSIDINMRFVRMFFADRPVWLRGASGAPQQTSGLWLPPQRASVTSTSSDCYSCASVGLNDASDHDFQRGEHHTRSFIYFSLQLTLSNATQTRFLSRLLG